MPKMCSELTDIKLPPLNVLAGVLAGNHYHELRDLSSNHPLIQL
jgi:hypothetical protein